MPEMILQSFYALSKIGHRECSLSLGKRLIRKLQDQ